MKALTLNQPYATLIAAGIKSIETRSWAPARKHIGTRIAIHAGKTLAKSFHVSTGKIAANYHWPRGRVIATAKLAAVEKVVAGPGYWVSVNGMLTLAVRTDGHRPAGMSPLVSVDPHGDFSIGRYRWFLEDIEALDPPVPAKGMLGLWEWNR